MAIDKDVDLTKTYLTYSPPKSNSFGNTIRDKNILRGLKSILNVFSKHFDLKEFLELSVNINRDNNGENWYSRIKTLEFLKELLGEPKFGPIEGYSDIDKPILWMVNDKNIFDVLEHYSTKNDSDDIIPIKQLMIYHSYHYNIKGLPKGGSIGCYVFEGKLFVTSHLIFPFEIEDERLYQMVKELYSELPFKLFGKHFRRIGPNKRGYGSWKLDESTQAKIDTCLVKK
jgi:hypothetical protein